MNKKNHEQLFVQLLRNDQVGKPDKAIGDRLMYSFLLKNANHKLRQNSFASFTGWLFSVQSLGLKTALISLVLFFSVFNNQFTFNSPKISSCDSISNQRILLADTAHFIQTVDSIRKDSLY
jgi:hypothetical protein